MTNFLRRTPGQPFTEYVDAMLDNLLAGLRERGYTPAQAKISINVTERSDDEIALLSRRAAERGLSHIQLVDNRVPARPGTVPSTLLGPMENASLAEARAARILEQE